MTSSTGRMWLRARRPIGWIVLALLLAGLIWLGQLAWYGRQLQVHIQALRAELAARPLTTARAESLCAHGESAADALGAIDRHTRLARGLLPALGWVPGYGPAITQAPALLDAGLAGGTAGRVLCHGFAPLFPLIDARQQGAGSAELLAQALPLIAQAGPDLEATADALARLEAALARVDTGQISAGALASYAPTLQTARDRLPDVRATLDTARALLPIGIRALEPGQTRRYLLLAQNSGELRATGGYIGTLGTVLVSDGQISLESFYDTYDFNVRAPPDIAQPVSYVRYMRVVWWYLRDTNWHADFPTSVRNLEYFWRLNKRPPVDGVIGVDLFAFQQLLAPLGPLEVAGYGQLHAGEGLESLFALYKSQNKQLLGALLDAAIVRLQQITPDQGLALMRALDRALHERHILLVLHDPEAQALLNARHWDGALVKTDGDYLMVVDSDFGYSEVALFIDARIRYDVTLDPDLRPLTATVTLDYSNGYDLWRQGHTNEVVGGYYCLPQQLRGCYRDFVRIYTPPAAADFESSGLDGHQELAQEQSHGMFANSMLLVPGEFRSAWISYRPNIAASDGTYRLYVQKQPGTLAHPLRVAIHAADGQTLTLDTDLWTDREIVVGRRDGRLALLTELGPSHLRNTPDRLAPRVAFLAGWEQWQKGQHDQALATWREGQALEYVIGQVNMLAATGRTEQAHAVVATALELDPASSRAVFAQAQILNIEEKPEESLQMFERALELDPDNKQTQNEIARLNLILGRN